MRLFRTLSSILLLLLLSVHSFSEEYGGELTDAREEGDFHLESLYRQRMEGVLGSQTDILDRTRLNRMVFMESVPLPEDIFFSDSISVLRNDGDDLWLGSRSGDIARYSLSERRWKSLIRGQESLAIRTVQTIEADGERIWFLSYGSVGLYSKRHDRLIYLDIPDEQSFRGLQSSVVMGSGLITGTQGRGLRRIRLDGYSSIQETSSLRNVTYLEKLGNSEFLAGTEEDGLYIVDTRFRIRDAGRNSRQLSAVRTVLGDPGGVMIGGTYGNGLFKLVRQGERYDIVLIHSRAPWITDGAENSGYFFFSTLGQGLAVVDRESLDIRYFGISEGLGGLDLSSVVYVEPYIICAVQGQGLVIIHEDFFKTY